MMLFLRNLLLLYFFVFNSALAWVGPNGWTGVWAYSNTPPGPFRHSNSVLVHLVPVVSGSIDSRTGLVTHHLIECDPYLGSELSFVFADIDPKFIGKPYQSIYPGDRFSCYYDQKKYHAEAPPEAPPLTCPLNGSNSTAGNPITISEGSKLQIETDYESLGQGHFKISRIFNNYYSGGIGRWGYSWERKLISFDSSMPEFKKYRSKDYKSRQDACTAGFEDIKLSAAQDWMMGASAILVNEHTCLVKKNNIIIKTLIIRDNVYRAANSFNTQNIMQLIREDGSISTFYPINGQYKTTGSDKGVLQQVNDSSNMPKWKYTSEQGVIEHYSAFGKLIFIEYPNGNKITFQYSSVIGNIPESYNGNISKMRDDFGNEAVFNIDTGKISSIVIGSQKISYSYNNELISDVYKSNGAHRHYHYEDTRFPTFLTGITDERGKRYATWAYDAQGRAISSEHAGVDKTTLVFNADGSTTVTNPLGKKTVYRFDDIAGARRVVKVEGQPTANCAGANQNYTYTAEGWVESKTDWKGIKTTYQYNSLGQEISRTEAFGTSEVRTITTEWHPTFYLKTKVTEPGKETTFSYDINGRLDNQSVRALSN